MAVGSERPSDSVRDCSCECHTDGIGKAGSATRILGTAHNSIDIQANVFRLDTLEKEVDRLRNTNEE